MNPTVKQKWIDALTSGEYAQSAGHLRDCHGFCCLGVLCDLYSKEHNVEWNNDETFLDEELLLPEAVVNWAGLEDGDPEDKFGISLAFHNDNGKTFPHIAAIIKNEF